MALSGEQVDRLRGTIGSLGWQEVIKPVLTNAGKQALGALTEPEKARTGDYKDRSDDYLRGLFHAYQTVLTLFENEIEVDRINRLREKARKDDEGVAAGSPYVNSGGEPAE